MSPNYFMIYVTKYERLTYSVEQANITQCKDPLMQYFGTEGNLQEVIHI